MAQIATCSIAERTNIDNYLFFSFINSGFIFPIGLAWCWNDGWLQNIGFIDYSGASFVHTMGGVAGFMGTWLIGPREGLFKKDKKLLFILEQQDFIETEIEDTEPLPRKSSHFESKYDKDNQDRDNHDSKS